VSWAPVSLVAVSHGWSIDAPLDDLGITTITLRVVIRIAEEHDRARAMTQ
jgi:hypothetical protein